MTNELTTTNNMDFATMANVAEAMAKSGFFSDTGQSPAKAIVKIMAGQEMGLGPFAAMTGLHIIKGKPVIGANLIATMIKNDPRYDYKVANLTDDACTIVFLENGQEVGESTFTAADAKKAGLSGDNWRKYARNMLFARAISNGAKWYTPGIFGGAPVYTPDEFGLDVDEDGDIIEGEVVTQQAPVSAPAPKKAPAVEWEDLQSASKPAPKNGGGVPLSFATLCDNIVRQVDHYKSKVMVANTLKKHKPEWAHEWGDTISDDEADTIIKWCEAHAESKAK